MQNIKTETFSSIVRNLRDLKDFQEYLEENLETHPLIKVDISDNEYVDISLHDDCMIEQQMTDNGVQYNIRINQYLYDLKDIQKDLNKIIENISSLIDRYSESKNKELE